MAALPGWRIRKALLRALSTGTAKTDLQNWELMHVFESSSEEVHPQSHVSAFTESRNRVSVFWGTLHLYYLFNFRGSALRKINFILCNLPLSYAYLSSKLYLLLWRPMSHETTFCPFTLYILGRVAGRELGSHWHAGWLALGPFSVALDRQSCG